ncbi:MAG: ABC transporter ATP-binding protein [Phycisphaeraceae bacterium]|nr:MAG: ABC transporter ATP-binding protein [Phycisphaeraceae bacterium]
MISIRGVSKSFGRFLAVDGVNLEIPEGESVALWGLNGAGKTTLIRCVLGLVRYRGAITVAGWDARRHGKRARMHVGYVPQELGFYDELGVARAVLFFASLKGVSVRSVDDTLGAVGLEGHGGKRVRELSGGMKQRLALAIAMLGDPPVLVLDEVTASLDACGRREFVALLSGLSGTGRTLLFASHRVEEVRALAGRVVMMERGRAVSEVPAAGFTGAAAVAPGGSVVGAVGAVGAVGGGGSGAVLHLMMPLGVRLHAAAQLRAGGFEATLNGVGLLVPVHRERKAEPFQILAEARIRVEDFEVLPTAGEEAR